MRKSLLWFGLSLLPLLIFIVGQAPLLTLQSDFARARQQYDGALRETKLRLTEISYGLKIDPALAQNLEWASFSAAGRILSGFVQAGRLDHLVLVDQNCQLLATSDQGVPLTPECPVPEWQAVSEASFQWKMTTEAPQLNLVTPMAQSGDRRLFLIASTVLRDTWIYSYPELRKSFRERQLTLGTDRASLTHVIVEEGEMTSNGLRVDLLSNDPWLVALPQLLQRRPLTLEGPIGLSLALSACALFNLLRRLRSRESEVERTLASLHAWAQELVTDETEAVETDLDRPSLDAIRDRMGRMAKRNYESIQRYQVQNHLLQQQLVGLESRLMEKQAEQAWLHQARSLHQQMVAVARAHIQKMQELQSLGEDLSHLAAHELARPAQKLLDLSAAWERELTLVSPRKFIRSLSERIDAQGSSELEQSLRFILQHSHDLNNSAVNVALLTQKLLQDLKINLQMVEHWHQMMGARDDARRSLLELLQDGQSLIQLRDQSLAIRFENTVDEGLSLAHLKIPASTLTSTFYHCHLALMEAAIERGASDVKIFSQIKKRDERLVLVLSIKGDWDEDLMPSVQLPPRAEQHLYLATQLIQGGGLKITQLPALQSMHAVALMWDLPSETQQRPRRALDEAQPQFI